MSRRAVAETIEAVAVLGYLALAIWWLVEWSYQP